jgi:hypothetical protein
MDAVEIKEEWEENTLGNEKCLLMLCYTLKILKFFVFWISHLETGDYYLPLRTMWSRYMMSMF